MKRIGLLFAALLAYAGIAFAAVNINSATREQLESLDGVGPVKAQAIIDYRKKNGSFKKLEDLKKVDGIGDATFASIRKDIALSGTTVVPKAAAAKADDLRAAGAADKKATDAKATGDKKADKKAADTKADKKAVESRAAEKKTADKKAADKKADDKADAKKDEKKK